MKNVTITLEEEVADWSRIEAAKTRVSVSRWIGNIMEKPERPDQLPGSQ